MFHSSEFLHLIIIVLQTWENGKAGNSPLHAPAGHVTKPNFSGFCSPPWADHEMISSLSTHRKNSNLGRLTQAKLSNLTWAFPLSPPGLSDFGNCLASDLCFHGNFQCESHVNKTVKKCIAINVKQLTMSVHWQSQFAQSKRQTNSMCNDANGLWAQQFKKWSNFNNCINSWPSAVLSLST